MLISIVSSFLYLHHFSVLHLSFVMDLVYIMVTGLVDEVLIVEIIELIKDLELKKVFQQLCQLKSKYFNQINKIKDFKLPVEN